MAIDNSPRSRHLADYLQLLVANINRDRILRFLQYLARFFAWFAAENKYSAASYARWTHLMKQTFLVRRLSRLGKNIQHFQYAVKILTAKNGDAVLFYTSLGNKLGLAGFLTCDAAIALDYLGFYKLKNLKQVQLEATHFWSMAIVCNIASSLRRLSKLQSLQRTDGTNGEEHNRQLAIDRQKCYFKLLASLCDLIISAAPLGIVKASDGIIGTCGMASTVLNTLA